MGTDTNHKPGDKPQPERRMPPETTLAKIEKIDKETGEVTQAPALVPSEFTSPAGVVVKVKRHVAVPTLTWPDGSTIMFMIVTTIKEGKEISGVRGGQAKMKQAQLMTIKAPNGVIRQLVVGTVLASELMENYPNHAYVGKWFNATKIAPNAAKAKDYATYAVQEIEDPTVR